MATDKGRRIENIRDKLEFLGCPYVENVDESWMSELLFKSGEPRLRLIQWLLARFDPQLEELFESHQAIVSNLTDSRVGKLLFCSNLLGLCHDDDVDLITGVSSKSKQLQYFEDLIDMLMVAENLSNTYRPTFPATPVERNMPCPSTLNVAVGSACEYVDFLCRQEDLGELFKEKIHLYPPDIEKEFGIKDQGNKRPQIPDISDLVSLADQIETELKRQNKALKRLQSETFAEHDPQTLNKASRTMSLTMSTLSQMVHGFIHCYETEMKQWSGREKPLLSELGPVFKRVDLLLRKFLQLLTSLDKLKMSHFQISRIKCTDMENNTVSIGKIAFSSLQECVSVLDEAVKRTVDVLNDSDSL